MEKAAIADQIVIIKNGKIVAKGTPEELKRSFTKDKLYLTVNCSFEEIKDKIKNNMYLDRDRIIVELENSIEAIEILNKIDKNIIAFEVIRGNMDDAFINIIGEMVD